MGGGDLNMKKSWHPVLLVNQERVWKAEKAANEEKKKLAQLRKEQDEERQLAELQRLQEQATGRKRVEKLDWMYAAPGNEGGALGGAKIGDKEMEDYLLGKRRVDEVLRQGEQNIGNTHKDFIAVQNANSARDTAAKIREDPLLAIKKREQEQMAALANRPEIRRQLKAMAKAKKGEAEDAGLSKEERREKRRREKEERRERRREKRERRGDSPRSEYESEDDERDRRDRSRYDDRRERERSGRDRDERRYRDRSRSSSPRRYSRRDDSPRRDGYRDDRRSGSTRSEERPHHHHHHHDPPRHSHSAHPSSNGHVHPSRPPVAPHPNRPSAMDLADQPKAQSDLDAQRAARLAAMSANASSIDAERTAKLAQRAEEDRREIEREERARERMGGREAVGAGFYNQMHGGAGGLGEVLGRRAGKGLQKDI